MNDPNLETEGHWPNSKSEIRNPKFGFRISDFGFWVARGQRLFAIALFIAAACLGRVSGQETVEAAREGEAEREHIRFVEDEESGVARLETVVVKMSGPDGVVVDLVGAVHVGDAAYYEALNERFKGYDAVLYELVGKPGKGDPLGDRAVTAADSGLGWIGTLQEKMRETLKLEGQLEKIDYHAPNFVHADMDLEAFQKSREENRETFFGLWLKAMAAQQAAGGGGQGSDLAGLVVLMQILTKKDSSDDLKRLIGREFDQVEQIMMGIEASGGTVIIGERNRVALEVLEREIQTGKKRLAVFYGAAHFPDMERRLEAMNFRRTDEEWLAAWTIPAYGDEAAPKRRRVLLK